jgi:hypothetical protein
MAGEMQLINKNSRQFLLDGSNGGQQNFAVALPEYVHCLARA